MRIEPGANAVVELAQDVDVRDAVHAQQLIAEVDRRVIAQIDVVVTIVRRVEADDREDVGRLLADGDALKLHLGRQLRHRQGDAVLHLHQGGIQIGADVKCHGQGVGAVVAGLRRHVEHPRHAVDLLLDGAATVSATT